MEGSPSTYPFPMSINPVESYDPSARTDCRERLSPPLPIVIDQGAFSTKAGWACDPAPSRVFRTVVGRPRTRSPALRPCYVGGIPPEVSYGQITWRSPLERDLLTHQPSQEAVLDHAFGALGVSSRGAVPHPVVFTEPLCNPNYCRALLSELLFEAYDVPSVCYGLAPVWSFHGHFASLSLNSSSSTSSFPSSSSLSSSYSSSSSPTLPIFSTSQTGLIISFGHSYTHIIPIIRGAIDNRSIRRLSVGGASISSFLHALLELHNPAHRHNFSLNRTHFIKERFAYVAADYRAELRRFQHQLLGSGFPPLPSSAHPLGVVLQLPCARDEEREAKAEEAKRRKEAAKERMLKMRQKAQEEKAQRLRVLEEERAALRSVSEAQGSLPASDFRQALLANDLDSEQDLRLRLEELDASIAKIRKIPLEQAAEQAPEKVFANEALRKAHEAIQRKKQERQQEKALQARQREEEEARIRADPEKYLQELRQRKQAILARQQERAREQRNSRGRVSESDKQRQRKLVQAALGGENDGFGDDEEDWAIYKASDLQKELLQREEAELQGLEEKIAAIEGERSPEEREAMLLREHQVHLGVELVRATEVLFQPHFIGLDEMGLSEALQELFSLQPDPVKIALAANVFITGGTALLSNLKARLQREIQCIIPIGNPVNIVLPSDPIASAWQGAAAFASDTEALNLASISRQQYLEQGADYLAEHPSSNTFAPTPKLEGNPPPSKRSRR